MKRNRILLYITLLTNSLLWLCVQPSLAQRREASADTVKHIPFYQGTSVGVDILAAGMHLVGNDYMGTDISIETNLKNRFLPRVEIGFGKFEQTHDETQIYYKTSAPFFRAGMLYNVMHKKPHLPGFVAVGLLFGHTSFKYDVNAPALVDPDWDNITIPFDYKDVKSNASWLELVINLRTKVYKSFSMGWSIRYKRMLSSKKSENSEPLYIPGFGKNKDSQWGITYNLIYNLPF